MNGVSQIKVTEQIVLVTFPKIPSDLGLVAHIFKEFASAGVNLDMISQTASLGNYIDISFTLHADDLAKGLSLIKDIQKSNPLIKPMLVGGNCKIQLFGEEMREMCGVAATAISAIAKTEAELTMITTSEIDISLLVTEPHMPDAVEALQKCFNVWV